MLELSSFQLETTRTRCICRAATVLNVTPDHLDRYASLASYAAAKARIFARCDTVVINLDDPLVAAMPHAAPRTLGFSLRASVGADYALAMHAQAVVADAAAANRCLPVAQLKIRGAAQRRQRARGAGARRGARPAAGGDARRAQRVSRSAAPLAVGGRCRGVTYIDDSKGTNVGATLAAVAGMPGPLVMIAGGEGKNQDFARSPPRSAARCATPC